MKGAEFRALALGLDGTSEVPHFERRAFKVRRIFASLAPDQETANLSLMPLEQEHWCGLLPEAFAPVPNKWGTRGWTTVTLAQIDADSLGRALHDAWANGGGIGKIEARRFAANDAFVYQVILGVGSRTADIAGVKHGITRTKQRAIWANRVNSSRRIIAQNLDLSGRGGGAQAYLVVHRVHRNGFDFDQKIVPGRLWHRQVNVDQGFGMIGGV